MVVFWGFDCGFGLGLMVNGLIWCFFFFRVFGLRLLECLIVRCVDVLFVGC